MSGYIIGHGSLICTRGLQTYFKQINMKHRSTHTKRFSGFRQGHCTLRGTIASVAQKTGQPVAFLAIVSLWSFIKDAEFITHLLNVVMAVMASVVNPLFWSYPLLVGMFLYFPDLRHVLQAVIRPASVLMQSLWLFAVVTYVFSLVGYLAFSTHYSGDSCKDLWHCFQTTFDQAFKNDGGTCSYVCRCQLLPASFMSSVLLSVGDAVQGLEHT